MIIVAPAPHRSALRCWLSDADEAIRWAELVRREAVAGLDDARLDAQSDSGEGDPVKAIEDVLVTAPAERIVLFSRRSQNNAMTRAATATRGSTGLACRASEPTETEQLHYRGAGSDFGLLARNSYVRAVVWGASFDVWCVSAD
jgi:hypothetical protein